MGSHGRVALAKFVMRGKESLVLIRPAQGGLMLHTMYFADEVRSFGEIEKGESAKIKEGELQLALQLIDGLSSDTFSPEKYRDEYRERVLQLAVLVAILLGAEGVRRERSEEHTSELQSRPHLVCRLLLEKKKKATL